MKDIFPEFTERTDDGQFLSLFETSEVIHRSPTTAPAAVVSTSLYWGTHLPESHRPIPPSLETLQRPLASVKNGASWWRQYFEPFLRGCGESLPPGWIHRVHLSADLAFLVDFIPPSVEIRLMRESSWTSIPGMLWRYLPMEEPTLCIARGADNYELGGFRHIATLALCLGTFLIRNTTSLWRDDKNRFVYRTIHGSCCVRGPLPFVPAAAAWVAANRREPPPAHVPAFPELSHVGLEHWGAYGQDEQFLCRWLYYRAASEKTIALAQPDGDHELFRRDLAFLQSRGELHSVIRR